MTAAVVTGEVGTIDDRIQRYGDRALRVGILGAIAVGLRRRDPGVLVNGVVSLLFASLPDRLGRRYGLRFHPWQRLWISLAAFVHTVGMLGPYDRVWWWDDVAHTLTGAVTAGAADVVFRANVDRLESPPILTRSRDEFVLGVTLGLGLVWEGLEYVVHAVANRLGFEPMLVHYGRRDTVGDLFFDAVGAALVVSFGRGGLTNLVESVSDEQADDE